MLTHYTHKPLAPAQYYDQTLPCTTTTHSNAQCTHGDGCKAVKTFFNRTFFWETQKIQIHEELRFSLSLSLAGQVRWLIVHWHIFIFSLSLALIGVFLMEVRALGRTVGRWRINEQAFTFICNLKRKWYVMCEGKERPACHVECELEEGEKSAAEQAAECNCCCTWPAAVCCWPLLIPRFIFALNSIILTSHIPYHYFISSWFSLYSRSMQCVLWTNIFINDTIMSHRFHVFFFNGISESSVSKYYIHTSWSSQSSPGEGRAISFGVSHWALGDVTAGSDILQVTPPRAHTGHQPATRAMWVCSTKLWQQQCIALAEVSPHLGRPHMPCVRQGCDCAMVPFCICQLKGII